MVERAVRDQGSGPSLDKHVLSFHWDDFDPHLVFYDREARKVDELPLDRLALSVGGDRSCVGRFDDKGYHPCGIL